MYYERFKLVRGKIEITQEELAKKIEIDTSTYAHYENNDTTIPLKHLIAFSYPKFKTLAKKILKIS